MGARAALTQRGLAGVGLRVDLHHETCHGLLGHCGRDVSEPARVMAQNAKIGALTDELIRSIVQFDPARDRQAYRHAKDIAAKGLRAHQYNRTNQFDVAASFVGLDEKFRVLNRDDLADALLPRIQKLQRLQHKWMPEYLNLLLLLSVKPTENSDVKALEILRPETPPPELTWKEILDEDPYSDEEIWKDIDYAAESSEGETTPEKKEKKKTSPATSLDEDDTYDPEACVVPPQPDAVEDIEDAQFWTVQPEEEYGKIGISELQAIRETLFMLAGLKTSLYVSDKHNGSIRVSQKYVFSHATARTMNDLLSQVANIGRDINRLRQWVQRPSSMVLIQTFEAAVRRRLDDYDHFLSDLQRRYLVPSTPIAVSLLALHDEIRSFSEPLLRLAQLVAHIEHLLLVNPFVHLETLFEQITLAQMTLEEDIFKFFSDIFFECLHTYLKPIRQWMESGTLLTNNETFFVFENDSSSEISSIWHDRFVLRRGKENALRAPDFLQPAAQKIFNTGKSVVFLRELGIYDFGLDASEPEPRLDHVTVCGTGEALPLSPFPDLFHAAFETWIRSKYSLAATVLRTHLVDKYRLLSILHEFNVLYLGADGSVFLDFADAVFERIDANRRGWNDRFLLTELARGIFSSVFDKSNAEKIVVRSVRTKNKIESVKGLSGLSIDYAVRHTNFPSSKHC
jgi:gamma-tubulin complex component 5